MCSINTPNYSDYLAGFPINKKDDTTDVLINLEHKRKRLGYLPTLVCSDGGGEFTGARFGELHCLSHQTRHQLCCVESHQIFNQTRHDALARSSKVTYSSKEAELKPLVDSFHEGTWLKALLSDIWNIQLDAATHYIDDHKLNERLMMSDEDFKEKSSNTHYINNKGLDDKLKKFRSNPKTRHIDLKTKGLRQEVKQKNIKVVLIRTFDMLADTLTKPAPKSPIINLTKTIDPTYSTSKSLQSRGA
ncbi:hypothetical protein VP01_4091g2 [Puccinia sorghi]|uniref:Integrase catalytic domain-containing protein n=1 Tax=Puccinia sorghi TaxID=27349 RepID=A0A0L6US75_9BASI|nr:hypothetical protein VP01_4091g2 [Puccinia sorghi]